jgi:hypothetical protein
LDEIDINSIINVFVSKIVRRNFIRRCIVPSLFMIPVNMISQYQGIVAINTRCWLVEKGRFWPEEKTKEPAWNRAR